jgi:branched-chain amino acid transport system permease protein
VLFIVIIGGSASLAGNFLGAAFIVLTPIALDLAVLGLGLYGRIDHGTVTNALRVIFGAIIILLLIKEPDGLASLVGWLARLISTARPNRRTP